MAWLDDILAQAQSQRNALTQAAATQGQASATGTTSSLTGGTEYPGTQSAAAAASPEARFKAARDDILAGFNLRGRQGKGQGKLEQMGAMLQRRPEAGAAGGDPFASVLQLNQHAGGPREGKAYQEYRLGNALFHVYIDPKTGRRQVVKFGAAPA